jgi:hypothetical protein
MIPRSLSILKNINKQTPIFNDSVIRTPSILSKQDVKHNKEENVIKLPSIINYDKSKKSKI